MGCTSSSSVEVKEITLVERMIITSVLDLWYEKGADRNTGVSKEKMFKWFGKSFDEPIAKQFSEVIPKLRAGEYEHWKHDHDGRLAYIIIGD